MPRFNKIRNIKDLGGETAIVTGADSGIGLCFCRHLAERHADIVMVSNRDGILQQTAGEIAEQYGVKTYPCVIDLTDKECAQRVAEFVDSLGLKPKFLINNAGIFSFAPVVDTDEQKINCFIDLHVRCVTTMSRLFGRRFMEQGDGYILNMSSMSCWMPMPGIAMYSATKAYIRVFSRALHYETRDNGVSITVACPGGIATSLFGLPENLLRLAVNIKCLQTPEKFTSKALDRMLRRKKQYINGGLNRFSIFFVSILPTRVRMLIKHLMLDKGIRR